MTTLIFALSLLFAGPWGSMDQQKPAPVLAQSAFAKAGWLVGCWHMASERGNPAVRMSWSPASNDLLIGLWIRLPLGLEAEYSFFRIESAPDLRLIWQGPGEPPLRLPVDLAAPPSANVIVFVNQGAGVPKRVEFRRGKDETLLVQALYEGAKALETPMKKLNCR